MSSICVPALRPIRGWFISRDPIGFRGGINLYAYVGNNPVNKTDPSGLQASSCCNHDFLTCLSNCIQQYDPLNLIAKGLLTGLGASIPKSWVGQPTLPGASPYTSLPSVASLGMGAGNWVRVAGSVANAVWLIYGSSLAGVEAYCTGACLGYNCAY